MSILPPNKQSYLRLLLTGLALCSLLYSGVLMYSTLRVSMPLTVREWALADVMHHWHETGHSPYQLESLPAHIWVYGPVLPWLGKLFGLTELEELRGLVTVGLLGLAVLIARVVPRGLRLSSAAYILALFTAFQCYSASPDIPGTLFFTASLIFLSKMDGKIASIASLAHLTTALLAIFTKPYFLIILPIAGVYLFFRNGIKHCLIYLFSACTLLGTILLLIMQTEPYYFLCTIQLNKSSSALDYSYLLQQTIHFIYHHLGITTGLLFIIYQIARRSTTIIDLIINFSQNFWLLTSITSLCTLTILLGSHQGAWMTYYLQLLTIPTLLTVTSNEEISLLLKQLCISTTVLLFLILPNSIPRNYAYPELEEILASSHQALVSPTLGPLAKKHQARLISNGASEYLMYMLEKAPKEVQSACDQYYPINTYNKIIKQEFDIIIYDHYYDDLYPETFLQKYYEKSTSISIIPHFNNWRKRLRAGNTYYKLSIYVPRRTLPSTPSSP